MRMRMDEENYQQLPDKLIFYILSYLPLSSLFKFRSVCKLWNTLFLHPHLEFTSIHDSSIKRYRIECSILHQRPDIPNPQNPSLRITLDFVLDSQAVKLISVHQHGYESSLLELGVIKLLRDVKLPNLYHEKNKKRNEIQVFFRMGVAYCIWYIDDCTDIEIDVLGYGFLFTSTSLMDWNGQLSFVRQVKDELHVLVLNDYSNFLKPDNKELMTCITFANNSLLFFVKPDKKTFCAYNINTGELTTSVLKNCITSSEDVMDVIMMMMFCLQLNFLSPSAFDCNCLLDITGQVIPTYNPCCKIFIFPHQLTYVQVNLKCTGEGWLIYLRKRPL
ncbi:hypothetical protein R3W88_003912 [Solanum pinnatisectum]|uniref:F-box domain-containing protein n=1 Tax=Solanum pinnatisectum TaxID=50273 RepID=A0AAV9MQH8_9SOLN|nr:hypothetical protein R3W88_003912 [Solanum pinnatisectum]